MRSLDKRVRLVAATDTTGFFFSGEIEVTFSRLSFISIPESGSASLLSVSDGALVTIDSCSFHCENFGTKGSDLASGACVDNSNDSALSASIDAFPSVGVSSSSNGMLEISNSLFFNLSNGAQIEDGGRIELGSSTFHEAGFYASDNAVASIDGCEFVNGEFFALNNCQVELTKTTFKRQAQSARETFLSNPFSGCLVKLRKGCQTCIRGCRFFATRPVTLERIVLDENEALVKSKRF